ncbi:Putative ribonuclease H protein At1g65750, partial [Linum perenne]
MSPPRAGSGSDDWVWGLETSGLNISSGSRAKDKLLTNEGRCRRGLSTDGSCSWCGTAAESIVHVLRDCGFARNTWRAVGGFDIEGLDWGSGPTEWLKSHLAGDMDLRFGIVCWYLWRSRNERLFAGSVVEAPALAARYLCWEMKVREAVNFETSFLDAAKKKCQIQVAWEPGPMGFIIVNSDGSVLGNHGKAAAGGLLRDREGNCIDAFAINLGACSITRAEIRGALEGIRRAWSEGFRNVEVQLDSYAAITIFSDSNPKIDRQHALEVLEFRDWLRRDWDLRLKHVYREANQAADFLASLGHTLQRGCHSIPILNCNIAYHIRYD